MKFIPKLLHENASICDWFAALKSWKRSDLQALIKELNDFCKQGEKSIEEQYRMMFCEPQILFSAKLSKQLDSDRTAAHLEIIAMCSEISSVAQYYLGARGIGGNK